MISDTGPIIVVTGLPRSGTSLAMQMLAAGGVLTDATRAPDENDPHGYCDYAPVLRTARDATWVAEVAGKTVKGGPRPGAPPPARSPLPRDPDATAAPPGARLAQVFAGQLHQLETWMNQVPQIEWITLDYPSATADPGEAAAALNHFLGGHLDQPAMATAVASTLHRQREPGFD